MGHRRRDLHDEANQYGDVKVRNLLQRAQVPQSELPYQSIHILGDFYIGWIPPGPKERLAHSSPF